MVQPKTTSNDAAFKENNACKGKDVYIAIAYSFNGVHGPFFLSMLISSLCISVSSVLPKLTLESNKR